MNTRYFVKRVSWRERFEYLVDYLSENYEHSITDLSNYEGDDFQEAMVDVCAEIDRRIASKTNVEQEVPTDTELIDTLESLDSFHCKHGRFECFENGARDSYHLENAKTVREAVGNLRKKLANHLEDAEAWIPKEEGRNERQGRRESPSRRA
ncbi:MAG: hypothetical protein U0Y68_23960 [Blastocatellia bacterium]